MSAVDDLAKERSIAGSMRCVHSLLLVLGLVYWGIEKRDSEVEWQDLRVRVLLREFMGVGEGFLPSISELHTRSHCRICKLSELRVVVNRIGPARLVYLLSVGGGVMIN